MTTVTDLSRDREHDLQELTQPRSDLEDLLVPYLTAYRAWLRYGAVPVVRVRSRPAVFQGNGRKKFTDWCVRELAALREREGLAGHGTDGSDTGVSTLSNWIAVQAWSQGHLDQRAARWFGDVEKPDGQSSTIDAAVAFVVGTVYPLHVVESTIRKSAWKMLKDRASSLPRAARESATKDSSLKTTSQARTQAALCSSVTEWDDLARIEHLAPITDLQREWLIAEWPNIRRRALATVPLRASEEDRRATLLWIADVEQSNPELPPYEPGPSLEETEDTEWLAFKRAQFESLVEHLTSGSLGGRFNPVLESTYPREVIQAAAETTTHQVTECAHLPGSARCETWALDLFERELAWHAYRHDQLTQLTEHLFVADQTNARDAESARSPEGEQLRDKPAPKVIRRSRIVEAGGGQHADEYVLEAYRISVQWWLNHEPLPETRRVEKLWIWKYKKSLGTAWQTLAKKHIREQSSDLIESFATVHERAADELVSSGPSLLNDTALHRHLARLWIDQASRASSLRNAPSIRDVVKEFVAACSRDEPGSLDLDWDQVLPKSENWPLIQRVKRLNQILGGYYPDTLADEVEELVDAYPGDFVPLIAPPGTTMRSVKSRFDKLADET